MQTITTTQSIDSNGSGGAIASIIVTHHSLVSNQRLTNYVGRKNIHCCKLIEVLFVLCNGYQAMMKARFNLYIGCSNYYRDDKSIYKLKDVLAAKISV